MTHTGHDISRPAEVLDTSEMETKSQTFSEEGNLAENDLEESEALENKQRISDQQQY